jgi:hypothetical protein
MKQKENFAPCSLKFYCIKISSDGEDGRAGRNAGTHSILSID